MQKSDRDLAIDAAKELEGILERRYNATGRGLHEKLNSVRDMLPPRVIRQARYIATMRNKLLHEEDYTHLDDRARFDRALYECRKKLQSKPKHRSKSAGNRFSNQPQSDRFAKPKCPAGIMRWLRNAFIGVGVALMAILILIIAIMVLIHIL